jgi:thioredoxin
MRRLLNFMIIAALATAVASCNKAQDNNGRQEASATSQEETAEASTATESMVVEINQDELTKAVGDLTQPTWTNAGKRPVVIDFNATWCGPCQKLKPVLNKLAAQYKGKVDFYSVDVDENQALASALGINAIPHVLVAPGGQETTGHTGL